jgi:hypothetical protein
MPTEGSGCSIRATASLSGELAINLPVNFNLLYKSVFGIGAASVCSSILGSERH